MSLSAGAEAHVLYVDFDHVVRWVAHEPAEFAATIAQLPRHDITIIGRTPETFARLPRRLRETEAIVNHAYFLATGRPWDLLMGARGFSRDTAAAIVARCAEDTIGTDVAWPLRSRRTSRITSP